MTVFYEWDIESRDDDTGEGDIQHDHSDTCPGIPTDPLQDLVLVRDVFEHESLVDRSWAYVKDGKLPERFSQQDYDEETDTMFDRPCENVPKRFHAELARVVKQSVTEGKP